MGTSPLIERHQQQANHQIDSVESSRATPRKFGPMNEEAQLLRGLSFFHVSLCMLLQLALRESRIRGTDFTTQIVGGHIRFPSKYENIYHSPKEWRGRGLKSQDTRACRQIDLFGTRGLDELRAHLRFHALRDVSMRFRTSRSASLYKCTPKVSCRTNNLF
jgi:hypothetical protein